MTDTRTFTLSLTQQERYTVLFALGAYAHGAPIKTETFIFPRLEELMALCAKIMDAQPDGANGAHGATSGASGPTGSPHTRPLVSPIGAGAEAADAVLRGASVKRQLESQLVNVATPVELRDRWQRNKTGAEVPFPEGCQTLEVELYKAEPNPTRDGKTRWKVTFSIFGSPGFADASCFDEKLFPYLANRVKQKTTLYTVRNGKYLNVVGVRA